MNLLKTPFIFLNLLALIGCSTTSNKVIDDNCRVTSYSEPEYIKISQQLGCITSNVLSESIISIGKESARIAGQKSGK